MLSIGKRNYSRKKARMSYLKRLGRPTRLNLIMLRISWRLVVAMRKLFDSIEDMLNEPNGVMNLIGHLSSLGEDNAGQIIVYSGLYTHKDGSIWDEERYTCEGED